MALPLPHHVTREIVLHVHTAQTTRQVIAHRLDNTATVIVIRRHRQPFHRVYSQYPRPHARHQAGDQVMIPRGVPSRRLEEENEHIHRTRVTVTQRVLQGSATPRRDVVITRRHRPL